MTEGHHSGDGIAGTGAGGSDALARSERVIVLLFASLTLIVVMAVVLALTYIKEQRDATCFRKQLQARSAISVRDTQLQDNLDNALARSLAEILAPHSTVAGRKAAVQQLADAAAEHKTQRAADDADRAKHPLTQHC